MVAFDPVALLETLVAHQVRFVVVGGIAAAALGSPSVTVDLDICYERSNDNLERLGAALRGLDASLRGVDEAVPFQVDAATLRRGENFAFMTGLGPLDCLGELPGSIRYEELAPNAVPLRLDGVTVEVASLDDLIRLKRLSGRRKDLVELEILGALRDELEARGEL